jgi:hypothetical protein
MFLNDVAIQTAFEWTVAYCFADFLQIAFFVIKEVPLVDGAEWKLLRKAELENVVH